MIIRRVHAPWLFLIAVAVACRSDEAPGTTSVTPPTVKVSGIVESAGSGSALPLCAVVAVVAASDEHGQD